MMDLMTKPMATLVAMYNHLSDKPATMKTFSQRSKAVERINALAVDKNILLDKHFDEDGNLRPAKATTVTAPALPLAKAEEKKAPTDDLKAAGDAKADAIIKAATAAKAEPKVKAPSIRSLAEALLLEVVGLDADKRKVGIPYEEIIKRIKEQHPQAKTTVACLRWYAVHMREANTMPPNRPRATPKKEEPTNG